MRILALSGSIREKSFNSRLLEIAVTGAKSAGAEVTVVNLRDYDMPLFNQDLEYQEGAPDAVVQLKNLMIQHQGLLIASPEYNGFPSPLLKNMLDWMSRQQNEHEPPMFAYNGKIAAVMSASPGAGGGTRGLTILRVLLQNLGVMALPGQVTLGRAGKAFREDGRLRDDHLQLAAESLGSDLYDVLMKQASELD